MFKNFQKRATDLLRFKIKNYKALRRARQEKNLDKRLILTLSKNNTHSLIPHPSWAQFKHLGDVLSKREKQIAGGLIALILISVLFLSGLWYFNHTSVAPREGGTYIEGVVGYPRYINPLYALTNDVDADIASLVYSGLIKRREQGQLFSPDIISGENYVFDLAASLEVSEQGKIYTFKLKENIRWHDGEFFNADDVIFTINSIKDSKFQSPLKSSWSSITVQKLDDFTVKFTLKEPFAPFLTLLTAGILPAHIWEEIPPSSATLAEYNLKPIGTGPYQFKSFVKDKKGVIKSLTLESNKNYRAERPYLDKFIFKFFPDFVNAVDALEEGTIDGLSFLPRELEETIALRNNFNTYSLKLPQYTAVFFNSKNNKALESEHVRKALAYATPQKRILYEVLGNAGKIVYAPVIEGFLGYNPEAPRYDFNLERSREILEQDGWKLVEAETDALVSAESRDKESVTKIRKKKEEELGITISTIERRDNIKTAQIIKENWEAIGVKTKIEIFPSGTIGQQIIRPRDYEALLFGEIIGPDSDLYPFWHSSQSHDPGLNLSSYNNRQVDVLLEEARAAANEEERSKKYIEAQNILVSDLPAIFLWSPTYTYIIDKRIKGPEDAYLGLPSDRFLTAEKWHIKTKRVWK